MIDYLSTFNQINSIFAQILLHEQKVDQLGHFYTTFCYLGSSFLLMKIGMQAGTVQLSPYQVASLRMVFSGIVLLPFAFKALQQIPKNKLGLVILSGIIGNFIPAYLFCIAETKIDSAWLVYSTHSPHYSPLS